MALQLKGLLLLGVPYQGKLHHAFKVKILTMGDECLALEQIAELNIDTEKVGVAERTLIDLAYLAQQIEIEGIPREALTPQFLLENLATDDYVLLTEQIELLRKKRQDAGASPNLASG